MDREAALSILGLEADADLRTIKHHFRSRAHDLHPDRGGDPHEFHDLQTAYRLLVDEVDVHVRPARERVARGRPSRQRSASTPPAATDPAVPLAPVGPEELRRWTRPGGDPLDGIALARILNRPPSGRMDRRFVSRAPGARTNPLAGLLDTGLTSDLSLRSASTSVVRIVLSARGRSARRVMSDLDVLRLPGTAWTRHRGDAVTTVSADVPWTDHAEPGARHLAACIIELLDAAAWPLAAWRLDRTST